MSSIQTAINWAINVCNADNIGYSQAYRNQQTVGGITYYDCSSFVWYALKAGGYPVESAYQTATGEAYSGNAITTHNMDAWLRAMNFTRYDPHASAWQRGDVMLIHVPTGTQHTEMVYNGAEYRCMGAHSSSLPIDDQVSISSNSSYNMWQYGYRPPQDTPLSWHAKPTGEYARTSTEALENAQLIYNYLSSRGWTINAVCGLLGSIDREGVYNPWRWESDIIHGAGGTSGYGLVQFTPASKYIQDSRAQAMEKYAPNYTGAANPQAHDGEAQLLFIDLYADYIATSAYPETFAQYKASTKDTEYLTRAWVANYERPQDPSATIQQRIEAAAYWYEVLQGYPPPVPPGPTTPFKVYLAYRTHKRRVRN